MVTLFAIFSCKKYGKGYVKGVVLDIKTNLPIASAEVTLIDASDSFFPKTVNSTITDNEGKFNISYNKKLKTSYYLDIYKTKYQYYKIEEISIKENKKQHVTLYMSPE